MRLIVLAVVTLLPIPAALSQVVRAGGSATTPADRSGTPLRLLYDQPAANNNDGWVSQSLPLGNGYMGVNLFGGVQQDRLQITENSLVDAPQPVPTRSGSST